MKQRTRPTYPDVWEMVARIPRGTVATYGQIAELLGIPGRARFIGYALHALPPGTPVPWHRVVNSRGQVSLPGDPGRAQVALLASDGVAVPPAGIDLIRRRWKGPPSRRPDQKAHRIGPRGDARRRRTPPG
jgi:methylated-DNA-protein-cysteine methyltransferase related protein